MSGLAVRYGRPMRALGLPAAEVWMRQADGRPVVAVQRYGRWEVLQRVQQIVENQCWLVDCANWNQGLKVRRNR